MCKNMILKLGKIPPTKKNPLEIFQTIQEISKNASSVASRSKLARLPLITGQ